MYLWEIAVPRSGHHFVKNNIESWIHDSLEFINLENFSPKEFLNHETVIRSPAELYSESLKVLVVRDLLNWFASYTFFKIKNPPQIVRRPLPLLKHIKYEWEFSPDLKDSDKMHVISSDWDKEDYIDYYHRPNRRMEDWNKERRILYVLEKWSLITKEFLGITNDINGSIGVYYDDFFKSADYRKEICNQVGGIYNEEMLNYVASQGTFSSIDGKYYQGKAQEMKVLERYKIWDENETNRHLLQFLKGSEALDLYLNNFSVSDDKKRFIEKWITSN